MIKVQNINWKISLWKLVSIILMLYLISGVIYGLLKIPDVKSDILFNKNFWLYFFSVGLAAFLNYFVPIPEHQQKISVFLGFLCGFGIMLFSSLNFVLL